MYNNIQINLSLFDQIVVEESLLYKVRGNKDEWKKDISIFADFYSLPEIVTQKLTEKIKFSQPNRTKIKNSKRGRAYGLV